MKFKKAGVKIKKYDFRYHQYWWYSRYSEVYKIKETNPKIKINKHHPSQDKTTRVVSNLYSRSSDTLQPT